MSQSSSGDQPRPYNRIEFLDLFNPAKWAESISWQPFREGVEIHRLYGEAASGPTAVLIRYQPGTQVPVHLHAGYEHIFILSGTQSDQNGVSGPGTLIINPPQTVHQVFSTAGCIVLVVYEKPVEFLSEKKMPTL